MNQIHEEAIQLGLEKLTSNVNKTAEGFFLHYNFHVVKYCFPIRRGVTLQNVLMQKSLKK